MNVLDMTLYYLILELWGMQSTPSLLSLPGPYWPGVVTPDRVLSMTQIELCTNKWLILNWIVNDRTVTSFNCVPTNGCLIELLVIHSNTWNYLSWFMFTNNIYLIYMNKLNVALNNLQWLICHKTKPNQTRAVQSCKSYASVFLVIPRSLFLGKEKMQPFTDFFLVFWLYTVLHNQRSISSNFLVFHTSGGILFCGFSAFNFFQSCIKFFLSKLFQFDVLLAINNFFISDFRRVSKQILQIFFPLLKSFFLAGSF